MSARFSLGRRARGIRERVRHRDSSAGQIRWRRELFLLVLIMLTLASSVAGITLFTLYRAAFEVERERLVEVVHSRARLIEAMTRREEEELASVPDLSATTDHGDSLSFTLRSLRESSKGFKGFGQTGEFTLARREGDQIVFLLRHRHADLDNPRPIPFDSDLAEPMRRALSGETGTVIGPDYRGELVLAAYEPLAVGHLGIVAKIDLAEVRAPLMRAAALASGTSLLVVILGTLAFLRIGNPMVRRLEKSEERYRGMFRSDPNILLLIDVDGTILDANPAACSAHGYSREELIGEPLSRLILPAHHAAYRQAREALCEGAPVDFNATNLREDGAAFDIEAHLAYAPHSDGDAVLLGARDVTERRRTEEALRQRTHDLAERVKELRCLYGISDLAARADASVPEVLRGVVDLIPPSFQHPEITRARIKLNGQVYQTELFEETPWKLIRELYLDRRPTGQIEVFYVGRTPGADLTPFLKEEEDLLSEISARLSEFLKRRAVEEELQKERDNLARLINGMEDGAYMTSQDFEVRYANPALRREFGDYEQRKCYEYLEGRDGPCPLCPGLQAFQGKTVRWEWACGLKGRTYDVIATPLSQPDGSVCKLEILRDVTDRKRAEDELIALNRALEERVAERTVTIEARVAELRHLTLQLTETEQRERRRLARLLHDHLQQLLCAAKLNVGAMQLGAASEEELKAGLGKLEAMIDGAIEDSRSLTIELYPPILYVGTLREVLRWTASRAKELHGLTVTFADHEDLPPVAEEARVTIFEVVRELLFNTAKYAQVDRAMLSVKRLDDDQLEILVTDEGVGFDTTKVASVTDTAAGFGLFSARERMASIDGQLELESAPGQGTRARLLVPTGIDAARSPATGQFAHRAGGVDAGNLDARRRERISVLVVDDHPILRHGMISALKSQPAVQVVGEASDGESAVELARKLRPDVVVMDVEMPRLDGIGATQRIVAELPEIRVIGLSVHADPAIASAMLAAGAVRHLQKQGTPEELIRAVLGQEHRSG